MPRHSRTLRIVKPASKEAKTWLKVIAGIPKYAIRDHYKKMWPVLLPQLKDRYVVFRSFFWDKNKRRWNDVIIRHPPGKPDEFIHIRKFSDLLPYIHQHAVEIIPEIQRIDELPDMTRAWFIEMDIKKASPKIVRDVAREIVSLMAVRGGKVEIRDTGGKGYHFYRRFRNAMPMERARIVMYVLRLAVQDKFWKTMPDLIELNIQKAKRMRKGIFLDYSSLKRHGAARAVGSIHGRTHKIARRITLADIR